MAFPKAKKTFGFRKGMKGMPSAMEPDADDYSVPSAKKPKAKKRSHKTASFKMGKPKTGRAKGLMNSYRTAKAVKGKTSSVFMSKKPKDTGKSNVDKRLMAYMQTVKPKY